MLVLPDHLLGDISYLFPDRRRNISEGMVAVQGQQIFFAELLVPLQTEVTFIVFGQHFLGLIFRQRL